MRHTISNLRSLVATMLLVVTSASASAGEWVKVTSVDQINEDTKYIIKSNYEDKYVRTTVMGYEETNIVNATPLVTDMNKAKQFHIVPSETEGNFYIMSGPFYIGQSTHERYTWNTKLLEDPTEWTITIDEGECAIFNDTIGQWKVDGANDYLYIDGGVHTQTPDYMSFSFYYYDDSIVEEVEPEPEIIYANEVSLDATDYSMAIPEHMTYAVTVKLYRDIMEAGSKTTICLPFKMSLAKIEATFGEGTIVRQFVRAEGGNLYFQNTTIIEPGVPYMIVPTVEPEDEYYTIENIISSSINTEAKTIEHDDYAFRGIFTPESVSGEYYAYNESRLTKYSKERTLDGFRGYFYATSAEAKPLHALFAEDETTGISELVVDEDSNKGIYTLSGAKVSSANGLAKGVYVVNGKKVIVK